MSGRCALVQEILCFAEDTPLLFTSCLNDSRASLYSACANGYCSTREEGWPSDGAWEILDCILLSQKFPVFF